MKRLFARLGGAALAVLLFATPAFAIQIAKITFTTAVTAQTTTPVVLQQVPEGATIQCNLTYGSGGTTIDAWVQTSLDGQTTWTDFMNFRFTTSSLRALQTVNADTPIVAAYTATDGTLAANTAKDGVVGPAIRVKYTSTGTYAGGTVLQCDMQVQKSRLQ